ncbi:hypothetical protein K7X08_022870 [Anisodus acutangulus]|uniref:Uncharacterized protein n=1 Tax=Anisodus acutangulus TaxID=402998 RepID=A0A9Q1MBK5_9SOLA|nr:hypothetical protein K7X08_022870 [Anisodus acutangulus]
MLTQGQFYWTSLVPVRVAGGLLFELLGQSVGDPYVTEDDIPAVLRSWQAQDFLLTALHLNGSAPNINVIGIAEVQELLAAGSCNVPRTIHEVVALLACRLARWDDRRTHEDVQLFSVILNQEIRRLSTQDRSLRVQHNLGVFGDCGPVLSIITGLFGINVDGIPGNEGSPYAFAFFSRPRLTRSWFDCYRIDLSWIEKTIRRGAGRGEKTRVTRTRQDVARG